MVDAANATTQTGRAQGMSYKYTDDVEAAGAEVERMVAEEQAREAQSASPVLREGPTGSLVYRRLDNALQGVPTGAAVTDDWDAWFQRSFENCAAVEREAVATAVGEVAYLVKQELRQEHAAEVIKRDREIDTLRAEVRDMKGLLTDALTRIDAIGNQIERAFGDHTAATRAFELELAELRGRVNGFIRDGGYG